MRRRGKCRQMIFIKQASADLPMQTYGAKRMTQDSQWNGLQLPQGFKHLIMRWKEVLPL